MNGYSALRAVVHVTDTRSGVPNDITVGPPHMKGWNNLVQGWSIGGESSRADIEINEVLTGIDLGIFPASNHIILWGTVPAETKMPDLAVQGYDGKWLDPTRMDGRRNRLYGLWGSLLPASRRFGHLAQPEELTTALATSLLL
jgi:hypothetical protein